MDALGGVYEEVNDFIIKSEPDPDNSEYDSKEWNSNSKRIVFREDNERCGEVLVGFQGNFTLVCVLCAKQFSDLTSFGSHVHWMHLYFKSEQETSGGRKLDPLCASPIRAASKDLPDSNRENQFNAAGEVEDVTELEEKLEAEAELFEDPDESMQIDPSYDPDDDIPAKKTINRSRTTQEKEDSFCVLCGCLYKTKKSYLTHLKREHGSEILVPQADDQGIEKEITVRTPEIMTCKYCDQKFSDADTFREHIGTHTGRRRFVCPYCSKTFASRYNRKTHINTHTGERPYKCTHCPKGFSDATNLEMHIRMHLRIMKYSCDYCDKRFVQSTEKKVHERTHTGEKPFQCEECGKRFISHVKLTEHGRRHKNIKNYKCEVCNKAFYSSSLLKDHMPVHTGERPFHCTVCGQNFPRKKSLRAHAQLHSNEKKYVCNTCGKAFAQCAGLYSHKKSHGDKPR